MTVGMPSSLATSTPTSPPPPPNERSAKSLGSLPSSTVIARTAPMIFDTEIRMIPRAKASTLSPSCCAFEVSDLRASSAFSVKVPPNGVSAPR